VGRSGRRRAGHWSWLATIVPALLLGAGLTGLLYQGLDRLTGRPAAEPVAVREEPAAISTPTDVAGLLRVAVPVGPVIEAPTPEPPVTDAAGPPPLVRAVLDVDYWPVPAAAPATVPRVPMLTSPATAPAPGSAPVLPQVAPPVVVPPAVVPPPAPGPLPVPDDGAFAMPAHGLPLE
jgi:hypothetical protein